MTADRSLRIGVVLEAFLDRPLGQVMPWLREHAPDVTDLEIGARLHPDAELAGRHTRPCATPSGWPRCWASAGSPRSGARWRPTSTRATSSGQAWTDTRWRRPWVTGWRTSAARTPCATEHEDPFLPATVGVPEAARLLRAAIDDAATRDQALAPA